MKQNTRQLRPHLLVLLGLGLWTLISYAPALRGPFFFDDEHFILRNEMVHSLDRIADIYSSAVTQGASIKGNFYRPNQQLAFALLYHWFGTTTSLPYHLLQILLHVIAGCSLYLLFLRLGLGLLAAAFGAGVFLLHPIQTEAVAYISGLADPLTAAFGLSALALVSRWVWSAALIPAWTSVLALVCLLVLALFTKEHAVVFGPMLVLMLVASAFAHGRVPGRRQTWTVAGTLLLSGLWVILKFTVFQFGTGLGLTDASNAYTQSLALRLSTFVSILWDYAKMIVWPADLFYEKPYRAYDGLLEWRGLFGLAVLILAVAFMTQVRRWPRMALSVGWLFATLLPFIGVVPLNAIFLEHWLYLPMVGVALGMALLMQRGWYGAPSQAQAKIQRWTIVLFSFGLLFAASLRTHARAAEWADVEAFYLGEIRYAPEPGRIYNNLGMYYADQHLEAKAIHYYQLAADGPTGQLFAQPHHNLAVAYFNAGQGQKALAQLKESLRVDPKFIYSLRLLQEYFRQIRDDTRLGAVERAIHDLESQGSYDFAAMASAVFSP